MSTTSLSSVVEDAMASRAAMTVLRSGVALPASIELMLQHRWPVVVAPWEGLPPTALGAGGGVRQVSNGVREMSPPLGGG
jgi:hypothetical protein